MDSFKEQSLVIKNQDSFDLKDIFECGQCFRWEQNQDNTYTGIIKNGVLNVKILKETNVNCEIYCDIEFKGYLDKDIKDVVKDYFNLETDYLKIKRELSNIDNNLAESIKYGGGIRILHQDFWEMIISYIISANNNIPRIKKIINAISQKYGRKLCWQGKEYYLFPTCEELSKANKEDLRNLGTGFRDKYIYQTTQEILKIGLDEFYKLDNTKDIEKRLLDFQGIGPKVADCIILFGLNRFDTFPVDVWVRRVMNELYIHEKDEAKVDKKILLSFAEEKFGSLAGLAQQYLFYWRREN